MVLGLLAAVGAGLAYGVAVVLQGVAARRSARSRDAHDAGLLLRLLGDPGYLFSLGLELVGFGLAVVAERRLALFLVQSVLAGYVAVAALLSVPVLGVRIARRELVAIGLLLLALVGLAAAAAPTQERPVPYGVRLLLPVIAVAAFGVVRLLPRTRSPGAALAALAGVEYAVVAVAVRALAHPSSVTGLLADPAAWSLALAGLASLSLFANALALVGVTTATAITVVVETLLPALVGVALLGDTTRPGLAPLAVVAFAVAVWAAVALAAFGAGPPAADVAEDRLGHRP